MLLQACLGLSIDGWRGEIHVRQPQLPIGIDRLTIRHLEVAGQRVDLRFQRVEDRVVVYSEQDGGGQIPVLSHV
jgi:hypothetical protein